MLGHLPGVTQSSYIEFHVCIYTDTVKFITAVHPSEKKNIISNYLFAAFNNEKTLFHVCCAVHFNSTFNFLLFQRFTQGPSP